MDKGQPRETLSDVTLPGDQTAFFSSRGLCVRRHDVFILVGGRSSTRYIHEGAETEKWRFTNNAEGDEENNTSERSHDLPLR